MYRKKFFLDYTAGHLNRKVFMQYHFLKKAKPNEICFRLLDKMGVKSACEGVHHSS